MKMHKIQITLTPQEMTALFLKAQSLGYNVTKFVKFLASREAYNIAESVPVYPLSEELEKKSLKALEEFKKGKLRKLKTIDELDEL